MAELSPSGTPSQASRRALIVTVVLYLLLALVAPGRGYPFDLACWHDWSHAIVTKGLSRVYEVPTCNYPPGSLALLGGVRSLLPSGVSAAVEIKAFKALWIAFDVAAIGLAITFLKSRKRNPYLALLLFNPAFLFDSVVWGQCDGSIALFAATSGYAALRGRPALAALLLSLGLAIKMQEIVFVPLVLLLAWPSVRGSAVRLATSIAAGLLPWAFLLAPFAMAGTLGSMVASLKGNGAMYPAVQMNAFNPWYVVSGGSFVADTHHLLGLSLKAWGLLLFGIAYALVLALIGFGPSRDEEPPSDLRLARAATAAGLVAMAFFLLDTEMHERYLHPAMLFFAVAAFLAGRYRAFVGVSVAVLLNEATTYAGGWAAARTGLVHAIGYAVALSLCVLFLLELRWFAKSRIGANDRGALN